MKKTKILFLSLAFIILSLSTVFADGWNQDSTGGYKYEKNGSYCFNTFIDDNGNRYYVGSDGYRVTNTWIKLNDTDWYYAGSDGKLYKGGKKVINDNIYVFDDNGKLKKGWIDNLYYANDEGYLVKGWQQLPLDNNEIVRKGDDENGWFYFKEDGKKVYAENGGYLIRNFEDRKYCFDQRGVMQVGWVEMQSTNPRIKGCMYFADVETAKFKYGQAVTGTWYAAPSPSFANMSEEIAWYYFLPTGYPKCGQEDGYQKVRIDDKYYMFNDNGNPVSGVRKSGTEYYYFGNDKNDCSMKTGLKNIVDGSGSTNMYYFRENGGQGYTGVKDNRVFYKGRLQKADVGTKYQAFKVNGSLYLVNPSGFVAKNRKLVKDSDGNVWSTNSQGVVTYTSGGTESQLLMPEPNED